ncbi:MAG: hypothetical protein C0392_14510 [Syntrophus sp. (in: bacteria)]|nr:hypothetical protein [Syntrophus sp. (in: bacteria)]
MTIPIGTWRLRNGLSVEMTDETKRLFGNYYNVKLIIAAPIRVKDEYLSVFKKNAHYRQIRKKLPSTMEYRREIVMTGAEEETLSAVRAHMIAKFEENALIYIERDDFPARYVRQQFLELEKEFTSQALQEGP